jgi:HK97 family phage major capsid protein
MITMFVTLLKDYFGQQAGATVDIADDAAALGLINSGIVKKVEGDPYGPLMQKATQACLDTLTKNIDTIITKAVEEVAKAQSLSKKHAVPLIFGQDGEGDPKKNFGDFCVAIARKDHNYLEKNYGSQFNQWQTKAALGEASGVTGGYTVPPEFYRQLLAIIEENAFIRPRAFVQPMGSATLQYPYLDVTTAPSAAGVSPFFGGLQMAWTAEAQTRTEYEPKFKMMELKAWELSGYSVSSNVLLQDAAFGLEKFLFTLFGRALAWFEEYAFLQGNGVGKPVGMLNAGATISYTRQLAGQITFSDVSNMWSKLLPYSFGKAIWAYSPTTVPQLLQLKDGASRAIFISIDQGITQAPYWSLLGRPAIMTEKLPALGTKGDLMLIDPSLYVIGDRMQIEVAASEHVNFLANQMTWRVVERVDGQPWLDKSITLQDTTSTVSPFVALN